jgi:hypothetical protein
MALRMKGAAAELNFPELYGNAPQNAEPPLTAAELLQTGAAATPLEVSPVAVPVASPTAAAPPEGDANAGDGNALALVAAFLRAIAPPLSQLSAALAALPDSGVSMAHLEAIASSPYTAAADRKMLFDELTAGLGITRAADRFAFMHAVLALAPPAGGA